jgi:hypothetical protein
VLEFQVGDKVWLLGLLDDTWEPASELLHLEDQLREFYANYWHKPKPDDPLLITKAPVKRRGG